MTPKKRIPLSVTTPADAHEWVSFEDPTEERTWVFDVTFLLSNWTCIFGNGCQGVLTGPVPELVQGCCSYGAHFTDDEDVARVEAAAATLTSDEWQFRKQGLQRGIVKTSKSGEQTTRLVQDACVFLNRPGWPSGPGCALHQAAMARGVPHLALKPDVCWQLPLRREDEEQADGHVVSTVREWARKHWGDGGAEFHWWCTDAPDAFVGTQPVYEELRDELVAMTTPEVYEMVVAYLKSRVNGGSTVALPHPAVRS
jgi:hypothetical protein